MLSCSYRLVFPEYFESVATIELINDIFFICDITLSFFKIQGDNRTLAKTSWSYAT